MKRLRLLVITDNSPLPILDGASLRVFNLITNLPDYWEIDVICKSPEDEKSKEEIIARFNNLYFIENKKPAQRIKISILERFVFLVSPPKEIYSLNIPLYNHFNDLIRKVILKNSYDAIICFWTSNYGFYLSEISNLNITCDVCDSASLHINSISRIKKVLSKDWLSLKYAYLYNLRWEKKYLSRCKKIVTISERDKKWLCKTIDEERIFVVSNGVDVNYFNPEVVCPGTDRGLIVFTGVMDYEPNHDAMIYCINEIWPLIKSDVPYAKLKIVGRYPRKDLIYIAKKSPDIEVTGEVDDIRQAIKGANVYLAPLRIGSGLKNKILEAMAMGIPVVTSQEGAEGIEIEDARNCLIANSPREIANKVVSLMNDEIKWRKLSKSARESVSSKYSWRSKGNKLSEILLKND